jgi:Glycosyl transferase family 2
MTLINEAPRPDLSMVAETQSEAGYLVSVIIPTFQRPQLVQRAVRSALAQTYSAIEVIVVVDGQDDGTGDAVRSIGDERVRVLITGQNRGPAEARNAGVQAANGRYVALLDDDDEWMPDKITRQVRLIEEHKLVDVEFIISCRTECRFDDGYSVVGPKVLYDKSTDLCCYLFDRKTPLARPGLVPSGTFLLPRSLALRVPFPPDPAHEELGWLLLCVVRDNVPLFMVEEPLFVYHLYSQYTRNHSQGRKASLAWARNYRAYLGGKAFAGLISSTTAWRAKREGGSRALVTLAAALAAEGKSRPVHWVMLCGIALLPLGAIDRWRRRRL